MVENIIEYKLIELLGDPDYGLKLKPNVIKRLKKSLKNKQNSISY